MYVKAKFDECKRMHRTYAECMDEAQKVGIRSVKAYINDIEKY